MKECATHCNYTLLFLHSAHDRSLGCCPSEGELVFVTEEGMYLHITLTSHYSTLLRRSLGCCPSEGELHDLLTEMEEEEPTGTRELYL